ncbi:MAG: penicillin-binding transpeptidase domain-containing protein [Solirubrobacteraceae bacterium]
MLDSGVIVARSARPHGRRHRRRRRRRLLTRALPIAALAAAAFVAGVLLATEPGRDERQLVTHYVDDWARGRTAAMYALLDSGSRALISEPAFASALHHTAQIATLAALHALRIGGLHGRTIMVTMAVDTRLWGDLRERLAVQMTGSGDGARVRLTPALLFPGLRARETLHRRILMPPRATLLASDGTPLAQGPQRTSPIPDVANQIAGTVGPIPGAERASYTARGYPANATVGLDGLELVFQQRLAGRLGGTLLAGHRVLASIAPVQAAPVKTTINPALERAAIAATGGRLAGIVVMNPRTGALEALAGIAYSALQPPGSTMKIITSTAALQAGLVKLTTVFPYATSATIDGFTMQNASGEDCGGTLLNAFAVSCNSVFAPLGVRIGAARLVATAERYGFNHPPSIQGAAESTIPSAATIGDAVAVGSSAIGQGLVQTTPLEMADVAATIAMGGRRPVPTLLAGQRPRFIRVTSTRIAREIQRMMIAVVQYGTGTAAQISGVQVAGKTGTAELKNTATNPNKPNNPNANNPKDTDAWFVGYAPVGHPRIVAGALFPNQGGGGQTAAPAVRDVIVSALGG